MESNQAIFLGQLYLEQKQQQQINIMNIKQLPTAENAEKALL
jgi:hypothetical protein